MKQKMNQENENQAGGRAHSEEAKAGEQPQAVDWFGGCPQCGYQDGYLNVKSDHWFVCHEHRVRWCAGSNLFSS